MAHLSLQELNPFCLLHYTLLDFNSNIITQYQVIQALVKIYSFLAKKYIVKKRDLLYVKMFLDEIGVPSSSAGKVLNC